MSKLHLLCFGFVALAAVGAMGACSVTETIPYVPGVDGLPDSGDSPPTLPGVDSDGGARTDGASGPPPTPALVTVADGEADVASIAVDDDTVYWATRGANGAVKKAPLDGSKKPTILTMAAGARTVHVGATDVYFSTLNGPYMLTVQKVSKNGGTATSVGSASQGHDFVVDETYAYLTVDSISTTSGGLYRAPLSGAGNFQLVAADPSATALTVTEGSVWYAIAPVNFNAGSLHLVRKGSPEVYLYGPTLGVGTDDGPHALTMGAGALYWADGYGVKTAQPNATQVVTIARDSSVSSLVADEDNVYWTNATAVMVVDQSGGEPKKVISAAGAGALAVGSKRIAWAESGSKKIFSKLK